MGVLAFLSDNLPTFFGVGCCLATALSVPYRPRLIVALILDVCWAISMLGWQWGALSIYPVMDCVVACVLFAMWFDSREKWLMNLVCLAYAQLSLHAIYQIEGDGFQLPYLMLLDITFAAELFLVARKGAIDGVSVSIRWLHARMAACRRVFAKKATIDG